MCVLLFIITLAGVPGVARVNKVRKLCNLIPSRLFIISICEIPSPLARFSPPPLCPLPHLPLPVAPSASPPSHCPLPSPSPLPPPSLTLHVYPSPLPTLARTSTPPRFPIPVSPSPLPPPHLPLSVAPLPISPSPAPPLPPSCPPSPGSVQSPALAPKKKLHLNQQGCHSQGKSQGKQYFFKIMEKSWNFVTSQ